MYYRTLTDLRLRNSPIIADDNIVGMIPAGMAAYEVGEPFFTWRNVVAPCVGGGWQKGWCASEYAGDLLLESLAIKSFGSPVNEPVRITQLFGENPGMYAPLGYKGHNGIDLGTPSGMPIFSVSDGIATQVRFDPKGYGYYVRVDGEGAIWIYAHLSLQLVQEGQPVSRALAIGLSGNSGMSTGAHLHLEVRLLPVDDANGFGGRVDPYPRLDQRLLLWPGYAPSLAR